MASCFQRILRKKPMHDASLETPLRRCYGTVDLTLMGIGSMVGSGIYVIVGSAARDLAGPSIVLSFVMAALLAVLTGACFAEFACRVPKTGSTYLYMYYSLGEIWAFLSGWGILCIIMLSVATNAKAWSGYFDALFDHKLRNLTETYVGSWDVGGPIAEYPDFLAFSMVWFVTLVVSLGAQCTAKFTSMFAVLNITVLLFVTISGFAMADISNWTSNSTGGFFPYGWNGVLAGSGSCFWAFTGFEVIAMSNEEARDPSKMVPLGIALAILIVAILYIGTASGLTLMTSYKNLSKVAPLPSAFVNTKIYWAKYIVSVGPLLGITTSLVTSLYVFSRLLYAIASDGLLPSILAKLNSRTKAPLLGVVIGGVVMSLLAMFLQLEDIIKFAVNLQLLQYLLICSCVILLRYRPIEIVEPSVRWSNRGYNTDSDDEAVLLDVPKAINAKLRHSKRSNISTHSNAVSDDSMDEMEPYTPLKLNSLGSTKKITGNSTIHNEREQLLSDDDAKIKKGRTFASDKMQTASDRLDTSQAIDATQAGQLKTSFSWLGSLWFPPPGRCTSVSLLVSVIVMVLLVITLVRGGIYVTGATWWLVLLVLFMILMITLLAVVIFAHKQNIYKLSFKVPCIPVLPLVANLLIITIAVTSSNISSWVGSTIVFATGTIVYFVWGYRHSVENSRAYSLLPVGDEKAQLIDD